MSTVKKKVGRYDLLSEKINMGVNMEEKKGQVIADWTPNNIKTLIIGIDMAFIGMYVTGGKFKSRFDGVNLKVGRVHDYGLWSSGEKSKQILKVLTSGRVCSNIQEIIFIGDNYPQQLLQHDSDLRGIATEGNLKTKYPRLKYLGVVNGLSIQDAMSVLKQSYKENKLVEEILQENNIAMQKLEVNGAEYNKTYVVRPQFYKLDETVLREHFLKEKDSKEAEDKENTLKEKTLAKYSKELQDLDKRLNLYLQERNKLLTASSMGLLELSTLSRLEWGYMLEEKYMNTIMAKEIRGKASMVEDLRRINYQEISQYLNELNLLGRNVNIFVSIIFGEILKSEDEYKLEKNKYTLSESISKFKQILVELLINQSNIVYMIYSRYLAQNGLDYVIHYYNKVEQCVSPQCYTQRTSRLANKYLKEEFKEQLNEVFKIIGGTEIQVKDVNLAEMLNETSDIVLNIPRMG